MASETLPKAERVHRSLLRRDVDRHPVFMAATPQFLQACTGKERPSAIDAWEYCCKLGLDIVQVGHPSFYPVRVLELSSGSRYVDDFGRTRVITSHFDEIAPPYVLRSMEKVDVGEIERRWSGLDLPDPAHPKWFSGIDAIAGANGKLDDPLSIWGVINGPFEPTWQLLSDSWVHFFILARKAPGLAKDIIDRVAGYSIEAGTGMIEHGADAIRIGDDYALNEGLMCSMATWKEFIYPYHKKLVGGLKKAGGKDFPVILHSDGNIMDILDLLVSGGIDALNPIQPGALEFKDVVDKVGRQLSMTGAFDLRYFLKPCSTEVIQEMQDEVSRLYGIIEAYNALGTRTGFCIGPSHQVQPGSDPRTFEAWARIAIERGRVSGSG